MCGLDAGFVTVLPDNEVAEACIRAVRSFGVDTSKIVRSGERIGIYFLEMGSNQRPSKVVYDRAGSSITEVFADAFDWDAIFGGTKWFHITGITLALRESAAEMHQLWPNIISGEC